MGDLVALEGVHALKHALRFGASVVEILTDDLDRAVEIADGIADELGEVLRTQARVVATSELRQRSTQPIPTRVLAYAERPVWTLEQGLPSMEHPTILLDDPRNSKNLGAVVRVGAATSAAGILVRGDVDFYSPMAVRGAAGLQWAVPCWSSPEIVEELDQHPGFTMVGLDAGGVRFDPGQFCGPTVFVFGSERSGLSSQVRRRCDEIVSLPMAPGVSSLNLATSVAAVMYLSMLQSG
ncbi:MAG: RNA methyltransferase [Propionibacteriaceae bacterium]|nr:RNA methyltransferase [Propionibacteriaceae bacterium]